MQLVRTFDYRTVANKTSLTIYVSTSEYTEPLEGVNFEYGFNSNHLKKIVSYWKDTYLPKWNERQQFLNQFSHFKTQIQGLNIHFMHIKPTKINKDTKVFPLLVCL